MVFHQGIRTYLEFLPSLFRFLVLQFFSYFFLLRRSQSDVPSEGMGVVTCLKLLLEFPRLPLFLFTFKFLQPLLLHQSQTVSVLAKLG